MVPREVSSPRLTASVGTDCTAHRSRLRCPSSSFVFPGMALGILDSAMSCLQFLCDDLLFKSEKVIRRGAST